MRWSGWKRTAVPSAAVVVGLAHASAQEPPAPAPAPAPAAATKNDAAAWHDAASVQRALQDVAGAHKDFARAGSYGRSLSGRELGYVELGPVDDPQRARLPALLIVAGLDGQHLVGTEMVLETLKRLADGYGHEPAVTKLLDDHVVYLIPRANPDGAERFFDPIGGALREVRGNLRPVDDDRDGALDEDGPEDLDKDGVITQMRWKDPAGTWIEDKDEPRLMRPADPLKGERGVYKLRTEGLDRDGDGEWAEDGPGDVFPDRNFPQRWPEHDPTAGRVPMSEPEAAALAQFVWDRPQIALIVVFGLHDNVAVDAKADTTGDGGGGGPGGFRFSRTMPTGIVKDDQPLYTELAKRYRDATGVTSKPSLVDDDGSFWSWTYFQLGVPSLCMHVWSPPLDVAAPAPPPKEGEAKKEGEEAKKEGGDAAAKPPAPAPATPPATPPQETPPAGGGPGGPPGGGGGGRRGGGRRGGPGAPGGAGGPGDAKPGDKPAVDPDEKKLFLWNDQKMGGAAFVPWKKVAHPTLGEVEVGGWKPYVRVNPPLTDVAELAKKHADFVLKLGELFAQIKLEGTQVEDLGGGLYRVKTTVVNDGWLPTVTSMGERDRRARPTRLDLDLGKATLVQGERRHTWTRIEGGGARRELQWLIAAPNGGDVKLALWSERAGDDERTVTLR
jgi:hypothetical protein